MPTELLNGGHAAAVMAAWVGCAAIAVFLINQVIVLAQHLREKPVPSQTYARLDYTDARLAEIRKAHECDVSELRMEMGELRSALRSDFARIHERVDQLPFAITAQLKNTGAIK